MKKWIIVLLAIIAVGVYFAWPKANLEKPIVMSAQFDEVTKTLAVSYIVDQDDKTYVMEVAHDTKGFYPPQTNGNGEGTTNITQVLAAQNAVRIKKAAQNTKKLIQRCTKDKGEIEPEKAKVIARLIEKINENGNFFNKLQNGKGIDEEQFESIYQEFSAILHKVYSWEEMPKVLVNIFIDFRELDLFVGIYQDEFNQHEEADKIYDAYERIFSLIFG